MEWINIRENFPEPQKEIGFIYDDRVHIGHYIGKSKFHGEHLWQSYIDSYNCVSDVKYWIPLPEAPK